MRRERNERLINESAVGVVYVQGPDEETQMSGPDIFVAAAEIMDGLTMLSNLQPDANASWSYEYKVINLDQQIFPGAPWKGMPKSFYVRRIDAALWRESNSRTYLFQGDRYVRMTGSTVDAGYPRPIAGNWTGLPADFADGIDAAFWHKQRDKIYMFKGDEYVRLTETTVDPGYPKPIAGNWHGLPAGFEAGIDAVFMHHGTNKVYMFKGDEYVRLTNVTVDANYPRKIAGNFNGLPEQMESGIDAALWRGDNDKVYFFDQESGANNLNVYVRYTNDFDGLDPGYPKYVGGLNAGETTALWRDAALAEMGFGPGRDGAREYADDLMARHHTEASIIFFITKYPLHWGGFARTPYTVMEWRVGEDSFDRVAAHETGHLFGAPDEYISSPCSCGTEHGRFFRAENGNCRKCAKSVTINAGYPKAISGNWGNFASGFLSDIDAAVWHPGDKKNYFFKANQVLRATGSTMDGGYPKLISQEWTGLPASFQSDLDAAVWREANNKIYLFKGSQYVRMSDKSMDANYPRPIAGNWRGIPASFESGIDAAIWRQSNDRIYFFKGSQYVRLDDTEMDDGYPALIANGWRGMPATFNSGVGAGLWRGDNERMYFFKGSQYARMANGVSCLMSGNTPELCDYTPLHFGWGAFMTSLDAAVHRGANDKVYLFSGEWYVRLSKIGDPIDDGWPRKIKGNWKGMPTQFHRDLDAALWRPSNQKTYFFKGSQYVRMTGANMDSGYPRPIAGNWKGLPDDFESGIDAALWRESNGKIYFFKGDRYVRLTETEMDPGYPRPISPNWTGIPADFAQGVDAALMRLNTDQMYMFKGTRYIRYTNLSTGVDDGYPRSIDGNWMPFPR